MTRPSIIVLLACFLATSAWPQESPPDNEADATAVGVAPAPAEEVEEVDDSDLDEQTYDEDEDDFVPSEEIPADVPIPFPSNI